MKSKGVNVIWRRVKRNVFSDVPTGLFLTEQGLRMWGYDHRFDGRNLCVDVATPEWGRELLGRVLRGLPLTPSEGRGKSDAFANAKGGGENRSWDKMRRAAEDLAIRFGEMDRQVGSIE